MCECDCVYFFSFLKVGFELFIGAAAAASVFAAGAAVVAVVFLFLLLELLHCEVRAADDFSVGCVDLHCFYV
jgi:hypothetical protein